MGERGVQEGTKHTPLRGPSVEDQHSIRVVSYPYNRGAVRQEVQDPVADWGYHWMGPQCLLTPPVSASNIYAAVVYVSGG